jgi:hypothetical protein
MYWNIAIVVSFIQTVSICTETCEKFDNFEMSVSRCFESIKFYYVYVSRTDMAYLRAKNERIPACKGDQLFLSKIVRSAPYSSKNFATIKCPFLDA